MKYARLPFLVSNMFFNLKDSVSFETVSREDWKDSEDWKLQKILYIKILSIRASIVTRTSMTTSKDLHGWPCWVWKFPYRATAGKGHWSLPWYSFFCTFWSLVILSWFYVASWSWKVLDIRTGKDARKGLGLCNCGKVIIHAGVMLFIVIAALGLPYFCK